MQSAVVFVVALMASASAHHLGLVAHPADRWVTLDSATPAVKYIDAAAKYADDIALAELSRAEKAWAHPAIAKYADVKRVADARFADGVALADLTGADAAWISADAAWANPAIAKFAAAKRVADAKYASPAKFDEGIALADLTGADAAWTPADAVWAHPAIAKYAAAKRVADAKYAAPAKYADGVTLAELSKGDAAWIPADAVWAHPATAKFAAAANFAADPTIAAGGLVKVCAGGACDIIDAASPVADMMDPRALAAAKYADESAKYAAAAKFAADPTFAAGRLVKVCAGGACKIIDAASPVADMMDPRALAAAKYADETAKYAAAAKFAADPTFAAGRLVKVCAGGACKIIDAASPVADLYDPARALAAAKYADDSAKYDAYARALASVKFADDAAKYAGALGDKFIVAN